MTDKKLVEYQHAEVLWQQVAILREATLLLKNPNIKVNEELITNYNKGVKRFMENIANIDLIRIRN